MLEQPEVKIATRNMFYDEQGKHRRTKKEVLDKQGNLRQGAVLSPKGKSMKVISSQKKRNGLRTKHLPKK